MAYRPIETEGTAHFQLAAGEQSVGAEPVDHAAPVYPAAMVRMRPPTVEIHAKVIVDPLGRVVETRDLDGAGDNTHAAFFDAVRTATATWRFTPMAIIQTVAGKNGDIETGRHNEPFSLDYAFVFSLRDGMPVVSDQRATP